MKEDEEWIPWKFNQASSVLKFLEKYKFTEVKFPFGTSSFGEYGAGVMLFMGNKEELYLLVVPYDRYTKKRKRSKIKETPKETALNRFKKETNLIPVLGKIHFLFEVESDESKISGSPSVHRKYFWMANSWAGKRFDFSKNRHRNRMIPSLGTPLWVESKTLLSLIKGTHRKALLKMLEYIQKN